MEEFARISFFLNHNQTERDPLFVRNFSTHDRHKFEIFRPQLGALLTNFEVLLGNNPCQDALLG
jgi:hypothetical protein